LCIAFFTSNCVQRCDCPFPLLQILALLGRKPAPPNLHSFPSWFRLRARTVHLLPIPSDEGCSHHYGSSKSSFRYNVDDDLTCVVTSLNSKNPVQQELPAAEAPPPPQHRVPGQQENFEVHWKELAVALPLSDHRAFTLQSSEKHGFRFKAAIPSAEFTSRTNRNSALKSQGGAVKQSFHGMSKSQKKRAKARAKKCIAAISADDSDVSDFLQPCDIARVRLFLCFHADVQNGNLPAVHMEIDPQRPLAHSIAEFEKKFERCR
jgi:hypothetical protein